MITTKPQIEPNGKYSVKAVCRILGIGASTLRTYRRNGLIKPVNTSGHPMYAADDILALWKAKAPILYISKLPYKFSETLTQYAEQIDEYCKDRGIPKRKAARLTKTLFNAVMQFEELKALKP